MKTKKLDQHNMSLIVASGLARRLRNRFTVARIEAHAVKKRRMNIRIGSKVVDFEAMIIVKERPSETSKGNRNVEFYFANNDSRVFISSKVHTDSRLLPSAGCPNMQADLHDPSSLDTIYTMMEKAVLNYVLPEL